MSSASSDDVPLSKVAKQKQQAKHSNPGRSSTAASRPAAGKGAAKPAGEQSKASKPASKPKVSAADTVPPSGSKPGATKAGSSKASSATAKPEAKRERVKKEKVEYDLPGQTRATPPEEDSLRKYYTSLLKQRPDSEVANKWCVQHGLCAREQAESWLKSVGKSPAPKARARATNGASPAVKKAPDTKATKPAASKPSQPVSKAPSNQQAGRKSGSAPAPKPVKRKLAVSSSEEEDDDDDDFRAPRPSNARQNKSNTGGVKRQKSNGSAGNSTHANKPSAGRVSGGPKRKAAESSEDSDDVPLSKRRAQTEIAAAAAADLASDSDSDDIPLAKRRPVHS